MLLSLPLFLFLFFQYQQQYGEWAVITGGSDGIGLAIANQLASKGLKIVLVGRDQIKLDDCAKAIASKHRVELKVIVADFSSNFQVPAMLLAYKHHAALIFLPILKGNF